MPYLGEPDSPDFKAKVREAIRRAPVKHLYRYHSNPIGNDQYMPDIRAALVALAHKGRAHVAYT